MMLIGGQTSYIDLTCSNMVRLSDRSLSSQATPFADEVSRLKSEERKVIGRKTPKSFYFALLTAMSQVLTSHLCAWEPRVDVCRAMAMAVSKPGKGKSGPVETGLTGPMTMPLCCYGNDCL